MANRSHYIQHRQSLVLPGLPASCHVLKFSEAAFRQSLFHYYGISCPLTLSRSVSSRRAEFLAGRLAARQAAAAAGLTLGDVAIGYYRQPLWPPGIVGSVAHDRQRAVAAIGRGEGAVGIDILPELDAATATLLLPQVLAAQEAALLEQAYPESREWTLALAFSAKESLYKALFPRVGRVFDFLDVELSDLSVTDARLQLRLRADLGAGTEPGQVFDVYWSSQDWGVLSYCAIS